MAANVVIIYGVLVILGGVMGYVKAKSVASISMGAISGLLAIVCGILMIQGVAYGLWGAWVISLGLGIMFAFRYKGSRKFMPAGLMTVLSLVTFVILLVA